VKIRTPAPKGGMNPWESAWGKKKEDFDLAGEKRMDGDRIFRTKENWCGEGSQIINEKRSQEKKKSPQEKEK